ncbi:MAG: FHA domain-containing protein [bacterium]|nr:FHA domain-containing protein [bacterium]
MCELFEKTAVKAEALAVYPLGRAIKVNQGLEESEGKIGDETRRVAFHLQRCHVNDWETSWRVVWIKIEGVDLRHQVLPLSVGQYIIGRSKVADVHTSDDAVSRLHLVMNVHHDMSVTVRDLESANGVYHNGRKIDEGEFVTLEEGDNLLVGTSTLSIHHRPVR